MDNDKYQFVVDYVREGKAARQNLKSLIYRSLQAYAGEPSHNAYADRYTNVGSNQSVPQETRQRVEARCHEVPKGYDDTIYNAVETVTSMVMGAPEQYKFDIYDKYQLIDDDFIDRMAAFADFIYHSNHLDGLMAPTARDIVLKGSPYWYLQYKDNLKVTLLDAAKVFDDPMANRTNRRRYRGFGNWKSFSELEKQIQKTGNQHFIETIGKVKIYLEQLRAAYNGMEYDISLNEIIKNDLFGFYGLTWEPSETQTRNSGTSLGDTGKEPTDKRQFTGQDVWVDYLWDWTTHTQYTVINERFVVEKKEHPLRSEFDVVTYKTIAKKDGTFEQKKMTNRRVVELEDPLVEFSWIKDDNSAYPTSPLWMQLDTFDDICAAKSLLTHNISISAPITLTGTSYDAEIAANLLGLSGEFIEGLSGQINVLNKNADNSYLMTYISQLQESIKRSLGAVDQYQLQSMIGDRATAEEVGTVAGVVSQRLNSLIASIESSMAEFFYKAFHLQIIFGFKSDDKKPAVSFPYKGSYGELTRDQIASDFDLQVKMSSSIKAEQMSIAKNAIQILGYAMNNEYVDQAQLFATLLPMILRGQMSAAQARSLIKRDYSTDLNIANMMAQARQRENARKAMGLSPIKFSDVQNMTPADMDSIINYAAGAPAASASVATEDSATINPLGNNAYNQAAKQLAASGANISPSQLAEMMDTGNDTNQRRQRTAQIQSGTAQMPEGTNPELAGALQNQL